MYSLDTSVFMDWQARYYPLDLFPSLETKFAHMISVNGGTVVSQETSAAEKRSPKQTHFIPDVCRDLGVPCINLFGLMRREGWKF